MENVNKWLHGLDLDPDKAIDASIRGQISQRFEITFPGGIEGIYQSNIPLDPLKPAYDFVVLFKKLSTDNNTGVELHTWDIPDDGYGYPIIFSDEPMDSLEKGYHLAKHLTNIH